jgi:hypothetical protein
MGFIATSRFFYFGAQTTKMSFINFKSQRPHYSEIESTFPIYMWNFAFGHPNINRKSFIINENIDLACELFTSTFLDIAKQCIPTYTALVRPKDKPWFNSEIRKTSRLMDRQFHKVLNSNNIYDWKTSTTTTTQQEIMLII